MKRRSSSPDIVALVILTLALLWLVPAMERHTDWLPYHTEWSGLQFPTDHVATEHVASFPRLPLQ